MLCTELVVELSSKPTFVTLFQIYAELVATMSGKVSLRVKCEGGQGVVRGLLAEDSLEKLISHSLEQLGLATADHQDTVRILNGFPPKPVDLSDRDKSISSAGIRSGDTIIFQVGQSQTSSSSSTTQSAQAGDSTSTTATATVPQSLDAKSSSNKRLKTDNVGSGPSSGKLQRKVVPADNSCLFTSINYCMSGAVVGSEHSAFMREVIASVVSSDPGKYCEAYLGRSNADYTRWIQTKEAWGGAIEVQILSEYFQVQILVVYCTVLYCTELYCTCRCRSWWWTPCRAAPPCSARPTTSPPAWFSSTTASTTTPCTTPGRTARRSPSTPSMMRGTSYIQDVPVLY